MTCTDLIAGMMYVLLATNELAEKKKLYCATKFAKDSHEVKVMERCFEKADRRMERLLEEMSKNEDK